MRFGRSGRGKAAGSGVAGLTRGAAGGEAAIRRLIDQTARGAPDYRQLVSGLADLVGQQLPALPQGLASLGPLRSVILTSAEPDGSDRYRLTQPVE